MKLFLSMLFAGSLTLTSNFSVLADQNKSKTNNNSRSANRGAMNRPQAGPGSTARSGAAAPGQRNTKNAPSSNARSSTPGNAAKPRATNPAPQKPASGASKGPVAGPRNPTPGAGKGPVAGPRIPGLGKGPVAGPRVPPTNGPVAGPRIPGPGRGPVAGPRVPPANGPVAGPRIPGQGRGPVAGPRVPPVNGPAAGPRIPPRGPITINTTNVNIRNATNTRNQRIVDTFGTGPVRGGSRRGQGGILIVDRFGPPVGVLTGRPGTTIVDNFGTQPAIAENPITLANAQDPTIDLVNQSAAERTEEVPGVPYQTKKFVDVKNTTAKNMKIRLLYFDEDNSGAPNWLPMAQNGFNEPLTYKIEPGQERRLSLETGSILASRIRIWVESESGDWTEFRDKDLVLVDKAYQSSDPTPSVIQIGS